MDTARCFVLVILIAFFQQKAICHSTRNLEGTLGSSESLLEGDPVAWLFSELDEDGDGEIDLDEFKVLFDVLPDDKLSIIPSKRPSSSPSSSSSIPTGPSSVPSLGPSLFSSSRPSKGPKPSDIPSLLPSHTPSRVPSAFPSMGLTIDQSGIPSSFVNQTSGSIGSAAPSSEVMSSQESGTAAATTNVTLESIEGLIIEKSEEIFNEVSLQLLNERYPRMDSYDIEFQSIQIEEQVFRRDDKRRLRQADLIGSLDLSLLIIAKITPLMPKGFDFQWSMDAFFKAHENLLLDRLVDAGVTFDPTVVAKSSSKQATIDRGGRSSLSDFFTPTVTVGIVFLMVALVVMGVFFTTRSMWLAPASDEYSQSVLSPTGRLGAAPSYDREDAPDPQSLFLMSRSSLSVPRERRAPMEFNDQKSITSYHAGSPSGSHLAGLGVLSWASFVSEDDIAFAPAFHRAHASPDGSPLKRTWQKTIHNRNIEHNAARTQSTNMLDNRSSDEDSGNTDRDQNSLVETSTARQRKRTIELQVQQSRERSNRNTPWPPSEDDLELKELSIQPPTQRSVQLSEVHDSSVSDESNDAADMILDVTTRDENEDDDSKNEQERQASSRGWFGGFFRFGRRKGRTLRQRPVRMLSPQSSDSPSQDSKHNEGPDTTLLQVERNSNDEEAPRTMENRSRPPRLDFAEWDHDDAGDGTLEDGGIETLLNGHPSPSTTHSGMILDTSEDQVEPDGFELTSRRTTKKRIKHQDDPNAVLLKQSDVSDSRLFEDPPTASDHRRAILGSRDLQQLPQGSGSTTTATTTTTTTKRKKSKRQQYHLQRWNSPHGTSMALPVDENSEILQSVGKDRDGAVELEWAHVI